MASMKDVVNLNVGTHRCHLCLSPIASRVFGVVVFVLDDHDSSIVVFPPRLVFAIEIFVVITPFLRLFQTLWRLCDLEFRASIFIAVLQAGVEVFTLTCFYLLLPDKVLQ